MKNRLISDKVDSAVFDTDAYLKNMHMQYSVISSFLTTSEVMKWKHEFMFHALQSFVSSTHFNGLDNEKKIQLMQMYHHINFLLTELDEMFSDTIIENSIKINRFLEDILFIGKSQVFD